MQKKKIITLFFQTLDKTGLDNGFIELKSDDFPIQNTLLKN